MKRWTLRIGLFYMLGLLFSVGMAWVLAATLDVQQGRASSGQIYDEDEDWVVQRYDRAGAVLVQSTRTRSRGASWSPQQAAGAPDSPRAGDQATAWASLGQDTGTEWLVLEYEKAVIAREVQVYENYMPGALFKVTIFDVAGNELIGWQGTDPTPVGSGSGTSKVSISLHIPTKKIKIYLASEKVPGWNEIDAVGLVSDTGELQWAKKVSASSTYASATTSAVSGAVSAMDPSQIVPSWAGLEKRDAPRTTDREEWMVDARGWPFVSMMSRRKVESVAVNAGWYQGSYPAVQSTGFLTSSALALSTPASNSLPPAIPLIPIWRGLLASGAFWGAVLGAIWAAMVVPRRFIREVARFRRGGCVQCGYDLGYDFLNGCPECGWRRDDANRMRSPDGNGDVETTRRSTSQV